MNYTVQHTACSETSPSFTAAVSIRDCAHACSLFTVWLSCHRPHTGGVKLLSYPRRWYTCTAISMASESSELMLQVIKNCCFVLSLWTSARRGIQLCQQHTSLTDTSHTLHNDTQSLHPSLHWEKNCGPNSTQHA